ncbi:AraC family transcriptional regulator [Membranihabitans maritimus]|uniref:AraC family transcriptional regulator n=1 Tax=Membranihabitans maritimus TaxID=2904244 RepID=UPI001F3AA901|nr:AraC family transcriptional regulator [Membranihabitans maritimus]
MLEKLDFKSTTYRKIYDLRPCNIPGLILLGHYTYHQAGNILEKHQHNDMLEICYLEKGKQVYEIESTQYLLRGGDLLITRPGLIHGTSNYPESVGSLYWMILKMPASDKPLLGLNSEFSSCLCSQLLDAPNVHFSGNQRIKRLFQKTENQCRDHATPSRNIKILNNILSIIIEVIELSHVKNTKHLPGDIHRVTQYIQDNIDELLTIDELSEITGLSQSRFKHKFRQYVGRSPIDYINSMKIEKAKAMVPDAPSIQSIGYQLNFSSPAYFSHVFKKYTRMTPKEYKKKVKN